MRRARRKEGQSTSRCLGGMGGSLLRGAVGGLLMGLANLVPGISGGTMLLATGVYARFVDAVAEVTSFRFRARPLLFLAVVAGAALGAIVLLAGPVKHLVETRRWVMYSVFIGLTLGGVPLVWRRARPPRPAFLLGAALGFAAMGVMAFTSAGGGGGSGPVVLFVAGVAGAAAMVLPGVSGAYLLLVLGQYEAILGAIRDFKGGDLGTLAVLGPVAAGVAVGIAGVSHLIRWALERHAQVTLGVLLGLLLGSVLGIWPFQEAVARGEARRYLAPGPWQALGALVTVALGYAIARGIDRVLAPAGTPAAGR